MKISNCELIRLLPNFMKIDKTDKSLSESMDIAIKQIAEKIPLLSVWDQIDNMTSSQLDELAWELHIPWYDNTASTDIKRQIIKDSDNVNAHLGTKWAVERVANTYFDSAEIVEWFQYDGEPFHFKVLTTNQRIKSDQAAGFIKMLNIVKRESTVLDTVEVNASSEMQMYEFIVHCEAEFVTTTVRE
ncbi:MAG: phage tail protein I [Lachnospiraceae bacterium]|nr:phage tail protein I [Lachnospiraceae bacterium]